MEFRLPELGENVQSADLIRILVKPGDAIAVDQTVLELETDKASFELPSTISGIVKEIHVRQGDKIKVGQLVFTVEASGAAAIDRKPAASRKVEEAPAPGPAPAQPAPAKAESPAMPVPAREVAMPKAEEPARESRLVPASPTVRRLARELGIEIEQVSGTGPAGRILAEDVMAHAKKIISGVGAPRVTAPPPLPDFSRWGAIEHKEMSGIRRKTAETMAHAWTTIPHVTHFDHADITELEVLRRRFAAEAEAAGGKLTMTAIAVKVIASALKVFPHFAASLDMEQQQIIFKKYCHIGVAVDTDRGLLVPVIRDADKKNIVQLSVELVRLVEKVKSRKITLEDMEGAVFTITNLGGIGGTQFAPIIHAPEVAILGISRARQEAVWLDGKFQPRLLLPVSLSYDHRLIDGADAARFVRWIVQALEQPFLLQLLG